MVVTINNKRRVIKPSNISYHTESSFHANYKGHQITIEEQEARGSKWYAQVTHPDGCYIVDGYFDHDTMYGVIELCLENIFFEERVGVIKS